MPKGFLFHQNVMKLFDKGGKDELTMSKIFGFVKRQGHLLMVAASLQYQRPPFFHQNEMK